MDQAERLLRIDENGQADLGGWQVGVAGIGIVQRKLDGTAVAPVPRALLYLTDDRGRDQPVREVFIGDVVEVGRSRWIVQRIEPASGRGSKDPPGGGGWVELGSGR